MNRGFVIMAQNTQSTDYVACAQTLAKNIRHKMPDEKVSIITDDACDSSLFDQVISLPAGDQDPQGHWRLKNDWQVYTASPYALTIKLEADLYLPRSISHWWEILKHRDLNICTTIRDFKNQISTVTAYRKIFTENKLPQTYNAITYFKKSAQAQEFYSLVKFIFENWTRVKSQLRYCPDEIPTTDVVYAMAAVWVGAENCTLNCPDISMIHMKSQINGLRHEHWNRELVYEIYPDTFRINTHAQLYPVHYHVKSFAKTISQALDHA